MAKVKKIDLAKRMGFSRQNLHRILREKTCNQIVATKLARFNGGKVADYLRPARPMGRPRKTAEYPFREFARTFNDKSPYIDPFALDEDGAECLLAKIADRYRTEMFPPRYPPWDFETLAHFIGYLEAGEFKSDERLLASAAWSRFKIWRIEQECADRIFAVEVGDDVS